MKTRIREFLKVAGLSILVILSAGASLPDANQSSSLKELGIILNTVSDEMNEDYVGTLKKLKAMGYRYIEGGYYGESVEEYNQLLTGLGLKSIVYGTTIDQLLENPDTHISAAKSLQAPYIACYYPWLYDWNKRSDLITREGAIKAAEQLNTIGKRCKESGLQLVFHNHDLEFVQLEGGETAFDIIMKNTDAELVQVELDIYWTTKGGGDPVEVLKKYSNRIPLLHMKDMSVNDDSFTCVGEGRLDFGKIVKAAQENGVKHLIVEHDNPDDGIHCAQVGFDTLSKALSNL